MKKYFSFLILGLMIPTVHSQEISDALRYAQDNLNGTARFRAMSGAFGALGGDLSAINVNPAGSAIFVNNQMAVTVTNFDVKNNSNFFGTKTSDSNNSFDLSQAGVAFVFYNQDKKSEWKKFSVAVNYDNQNNFNNNLFSAGVNQNSIANYFLSYANPSASQGGIYLSTLQNSYYENLNYADQQAFLGYQGYIINPVDPNNQSNSVYNSNVRSGGNYYQENSIYSKGYNGKLAFNAAAQYKNWLNIGINLNSHFTDYRQSTSFYESNSNPLNATSMVNRLRFNNDLYTYGSGFSFQVGAIAKVNKEFRLGLAYQSPTWYRLNDEFTQTLSSVTKSTSGENSYTVDPRITNIYDPYKLQTPSKWTGSLAYVFGKKGLLSLDYSIKDYSKTQFKPQNEFVGVNQSMSNLLTVSNELRLGAEYKIKQWSLRGGYLWEQSPYSDKTTVGDLTGYSGGLGYNFGGTKLDLAYSYAKRDSQLQSFSQGLVDRANINSVFNNITLTLAFEL